MIIYVIAFIICVACDFISTRLFLSVGLEEASPILGRHPSFLKQAVWLSFLAFAIGIYIYIFQIGAIPFMIVVYFVYIVTVVRNLRAWHNEKT